jgi:Asp-tRNA(Asn)/Glu-tRNA(Gln) amidotransferase B subunit
MKTLKDMLEVPLEDLAGGVKQWIDHSCKFWEDWLSQYNVATAMEAGEEKTETPEHKPEETKIPDDLAAVIEFNKAIVEKYQSTGAESLLKHLTAQLAKERGIKDLDKRIEDIDQTTGEMLFEELKNALKVSPEKQELLGMDKSLRAEHVITKVLDANAGVIAKIMNGDKDIVKELDKQAIENACGTVDPNDLKFALRSMIQILLAKEKESNA